MLVYRCAAAITFLFCYIFTSNIIHHLRKTTALLVLALTIIEEITPGSSSW